MSLRSVQFTETSPLISAVRAHRHAATDNHRKAVTQYILVALASDSALIPPYATSDDVATGQIADIALKRSLRYVWQMTYASLLRSIDDINVNQFRLPKRDVAPAVWEARHREWATIKTTYGAGSNPRFDVGAGPLPTVNASIAF